MKLILANNQSKKFTDFYTELNKSSSEPFDYAGYSSLLFLFNEENGQPIEVINLASSRSLNSYSGVYINGYLSTYELAATTAIACQALNIGYENHEFANPVSLSKLSMYAKLAKAGVKIPKSVAGTKAALALAEDYLGSSFFPAILKRADADRGIDNFKIENLDEAKKLMEPHAPRSLWLLQRYVENQGFYLVSIYHGEPVFCIFRSLEKRPDNNAQKAHMYKPKGGANASLMPIENVPPPLIDISLRAAEAMDRQIASVDCLYNDETQEAWVLEVNYNPQLVTIETLKDVRVEAFLRALPNIGNYPSK